MLPEAQFFVRAFPSPDKDWNNVKLDSNQKLIYLRSLEDLRRGKSGSNIYWQFKVDKIFLNISQGEFYNTIVPKNLLQSVFKGNNLVILCFGSSNTGKSYSAFGIYNRFEYRGIAPRLLEDIFKTKEEIAEMYRTEISLAHVEIVGKNVYNLLEKGKPIILKSGKITDHGYGTRLETICQGMKLIFDGDGRRKFEYESSHCGTTVLTFDITCASLLPSNPITAAGKIHLIDTAGTDNGNYPTKSFKCHVNANMTKCELNTLCSWYGNKGDAKQTLLSRGSTLALYLGPSITNSYSRLIGHIRTSYSDLGNSMSTLLFGTRLRKLHSPLLVQAKTKNADLIIRGLQDEIQEIKDNIIGEKLVRNVFMPNTISQGQMEYVLREIQLYCQSPSYQPSILLAKAHPLILVLGFREVYNRDIKELKDYFEKELEGKDKAIEQDRQRSKRPSSSWTSVHKKTSPSVGTLTAGAGASRTYEVPPEKKSMDEQGTKLEFESITTTEDNYARTFSEYLNKSAEIKLKIKGYEQDIEVTLNAKSELQSKLTDLKQKIDLLNIELEKEEWNTFYKKLENNIFTRDGKEMFKSPEEEKLEYEIEAQVNEFNETRSALYETHNKYLTIRYELNEIHTNLEREYNEYIKLVYNNMLMLPPALYVSKELQCPQPPGETVKKEPETIDRKAENCFYKLQRKPLKKSVKNP